MSQDAELNLRIVSTHDFMAGRSDKGLADFLPQFGANRDVLQVGVRRRKASGRRNCLLPGSVDTPCLLADECGERVNVGALEFRNLADLEDDIWQLVFFGESFQSLRISGARGL